jgi:5,5'-dehydrodivanillate O-demethylase oxygenase subunit
MDSPNGRGNGTYAESDFVDFAHTGPGTLAGRYLRSFWQPIHRSRDLVAGRPIPIRVMSQDFTLYRGESSTAHLLDLRCAHRGTQLNTGWVEGDNIRCRFHGWAFDGSGQCVDQPVEPEPFCQEVRIRSYPTEEYLGYIFAYLGEGEAPPLPRYPEFDEADGVLEAVAPQFSSCNFFQRVELVGDEAHLLYAHRFDKPYGKAAIPRIEADETEYGVAQRGTRPNGLTRYTHLLMPNIMYTSNNPQYPEEFGTRVRIVWKVPIDDEHYWDTGVLLVRIKGEAAERYRERARANEEARSHANTQQVLASILASKIRLEEVEDRSDMSHLEDEVVLVGQGAIADRRHERLGQTDVALVMIRQVWERELRALAEGRPLKQWTVPGQLTVADGI